MTVKTLFNPQVLLEAGEGFLDVKAVKGDDGKPDLLLTMDRSKIQSVGKQAIGAFLQKLQVRSSTRIMVFKGMANKGTQDCDLTKGNEYSKIVEHKRISKQFLSLEIRLQISLVSSKAL